MKYFFIFTLAALTLGALSGCGRNRHRHIEQSYYCEPQTRYYHYEERRIGRDWRDDRRDFDCDDDDFDDDDWRKRERRRWRYDD